MDGRTCDVQCDIPIMKWQNSSEYNAQRNEMVSF